jgi:hypothetical protein
MREARLGPRRSRERVAQCGPAALRGGANPAHVRGGMNLSHSLSQRLIPPPEHAPQLRVLHEVADLI